MSGIAFLRNALKTPPATAPLSITELNLTVRYTGAFKRSADFKGRAEVNLKALGYVEKALRRGFFNWTAFDRRDKARLVCSYDKSQNLIISGTFPGIHYNFLVALLRELVTRNHLTQKDQDDRALVLDREKSAGDLVQFDQIVEAIEITKLEGEWFGRLERPDPALFVFGKDIALPANNLNLARADLATLATQVDALAINERMVASGRGQGRHFDPEPFATTVDLFLRLCDMGMFRPLAEIESRNYEGEFEIFLRDNADGQAIVIDDYNPEIYGLVEFLNCASGGHAGALRLDVEE